MGRTSWLCFFILGLCGAEASAQSTILVARPAAQKALKAAAKPAHAAAVKAFKDAGYKVVRAKRRSGRALRKCRNSRCFAQVGKKANADYVVHFALVQRKSLAVVQLSLIQVSTAEKLGVQRLGVQPSLSEIEAAAGQCAKHLAKAIRAPALLASKPVPPAAVKPPPTKPQPMVTPPPKPLPKVVAQPAPSPAPAVRQQIAAPLEEGSGNLFAWSTMGVGLGAAVAGGAFAFLRAQDISSLETTPQVEAQRRSDLATSANSKGQVALPLLVSGGVALVTGTVLWLTGVGAFDASVPALGMQTGPVSVIRF